MMIQSVDKWFGPSPIAIGSTSRKYRSGARHELYSQGFHGRPTEYVLSFYQQPVRSHLRWMVYEFWSRCTWRLIKRIEGWPWKWHARRCRGCAIGKRRDGTTRPVCAYVPWSNRQDIKAYDLGQKNRVKLFEMKLTKDQAIALGWSSGED